jgi:hypothetical protein
MAKPFTTVLGEFGFTNEPDPDTTVHVPTAGDVGVFAANVALFPTHTVWSGPALAAGEVELKTTICMSSVSVPHGPLLMVQRKVFTPTPNPVTVVDAELGLVMVPVPEIKVHVAVAGDCGNVSAVKVAEADVLPILQTD